MDFEAGVHTNKHVKLEVNIIIGTLSQEKCLTVWTVHCVGMILQGQKRPYKTATKDRLNQPTSVLRVFDDFPPAMLLMFPHLLSVQLHQLYVIFHSPTYTISQEFWW